MYKATFVFESENPIHEIVSELLTNPDTYDYVKSMTNNGEPFEIQYHFDEMDPKGETIAIGSGGIDSADAEEDY